MMEKKIDDSRLVRPTGKFSAVPEDHKPVSSDSDSDEDEKLVEPNPECPCSWCKALCLEKAQKSKVTKKTLPGQKVQGNNPLGRKRAAQTNSEVEEPFPGFRSAKELCTRWPRK
jgi:hypothetical protein